MNSMRIRRLLISGSLAMFVLPTGAVSAASEVAPPTMDETLVYVMREGRFAGSGGKIWIAVNDQTVARVKNKGHAIVRAKAGRITVNLATTGISIAPIALDDRPGETVYLKWRLGDLLFREVDEAEGKKFLRKSKQTAPIDEMLPNNEEVASLINLSRLGFELMQPASKEVVPDDEHAVVTFFRGSESEAFEFGIWGQQGFVGTLSANSAVSINVVPGEHFFIAGNVGKSLLKVQAEAGKRYYALLDIGRMIGRVRLTPVALEDSAKLDRWLNDVEWMELTPDAKTDRIKERESIVTDFVKHAVERTVTGQSNFHLLGREHAF